MIERQSRTYTPHRQRLYLAYHGLDKGHWERWMQDSPWPGGGHPLAADEATEEHAIVSLLWVAR